MADKSQERPRNVVMVDAENPLVEVHGEFFWREEHDKIVAAARDEAYRQGYAEASAKALRHAPPVQEIVLRRRRSPLSRLIWRVVITLLLLAFLAVTLGVVLERVLLQS